MSYFKRISLNRIWRLSIFFALALMLVLAACSESQPATDSLQATPAPEATATPIQEPTVPPEPTPEAPADTPESASAHVPTPAATQEPTSTPAPEPETYPLEVTDMLGRPITIPAMPERIVSISPTATEILYAVGGSAVARDSGSVYPDEVLHLPEIGGAYSPSFESVAAQRPDLVLIEALTQARFLEPLSQFGAPVVALRATSLDDIATGMRLVGQIIDADASAEQAALGLSDRVSTAIEGLDDGMSALILISDADRNLYVAKPQSYPGAIASMLNLSNPAADLPDSGTFPGFAQVSGEQLLTMDPDFLFTITPAPEPAPKLSTVLPRLPGFAGLQAITSGQMHEIDHIIFLRNQGPRIAEAVEAMAELVGGAP